MDVCYKCGASGDKVVLRDAISNKGIVKICYDCACAERIPIIRKMTETQLAESQKQKSVRERLSGMSRNPLTQREVTLRDIVDKKVKMNQVPTDLIENFHWTIQRIKRARRITREEFAKAIGESDATVRMIEQGYLPNNDYKIINKIESYLKVNLRKSGTSGFPDTSMSTSGRRFVLDNSLIEKEKKEEAPKKLSFKMPEAKQLKISDLKEMKKKSDSGDDSWEEEYSQDDEKFLDEPDAFDEDE
jgi:ribosome-binding protein aMBF1 (putative translation factor)